MSEHRHVDKKLGHVYRHHPRSDALSIELCQLIAADLVQRCKTLRDQAARGEVAYGINLKHFLVAFSCKGRDLCPSCASRRMVDVSAHMVEQVLPRVQHRQWVLSMPKRVRWHLRHKPEVISGLLTVFLRAVETTLRQRSPGAPPGARFGAVAFVHRFGSYLNPPYSHRFDLPA
jgi:hypothetical protein